MAQLPKSINNLVNAFGQLPGIGPKSATRLAFYLLTTPTTYVANLAGAMLEVKEKVKACRECYSVTESELCDVCKDEKRNHRQICVVERAMDMLAIENVGGYGGVYHVLGGVVNPLEHVGPEDLKIAELLKRLGNWSGSGRTSDDLEIILAMNPTMEGEATALYIKNQIAKVKGLADIKITRIGSGLPMGADLEFADQATIARAMEGRRGL